MRDAYIVTSIRTPGCKRAKGALKDTRPEELAAFILNEVVDRTPNLEKKDVEDIMLGCAFPEAEQGLNIGRVVTLMAGFPVEVTGATINRFCSSGIEAIALAAMRVMCGWLDITIGAGLESMTYVPMLGSIPRPHPEFSREHPDVFISMGLTAENVAKRYHVSREDQDAFAYHSHMKAAEARKTGRFTEVVPTPATRHVLQENGTYKKETVLVEHDDGIRPETTMEDLAKLKPVFKKGGTVTAGNASQMTDGAAATLLMSEDKVKDLGLSPVAKLKGYAVAGCQPDEMGMGPVYAVPRLLRQTGIDLKDVGLVEINEAFAAQALACIRKLELDPEKVNVNGGAIALGHPLGCTGAKLCATLLANMKARGVKYGIETMCIGGGMGAAALFELCE
ncbi:MAG: thiolase family protein [Deltaproteobacteria bacterium]|nr:thiolase family protein [Deltaproteobacteria bacterium]MBW2042743.1 thiolase family protein [Deltaproteobacteria bacterium]MBW2132151.1 thiolase family protein [Deltaproteobacteria bacterium]